MRKTGIYLFCFAGPQAAVEGIEGVAVQNFGDCSAVVAEVPLEEFSGEHLEDLGWLAPRACRHEAVVEAAMRGSPVLPAGFGTVFSSAAALGLFVEAHREEIRAFLAEAAGQEEWAVKALVDTAHLQPAATQAALAGPSPGARYLAQKKAQAAAPALQPLESAAAEVAGDLLRLASALVDRRPVSEPGRRVLKNWAFLVPKDQAESFRALANAVAGRMASQGVEFRVSGPWPPYSFVPELGPVAKP